MAEMNRVLEAQAAFLNCSIFLFPCLWNSIKCTFAGPGLGTSVKESLASTKGQNTFHPNLVIFFVSVTMIAWSPHISLKESHANCSWISQLRQFYKLAPNPPLVQSLLSVKVSLKKQTMGVYMFPRAAITKYHKLGSLRDSEIYCLTSLKARSLKSRCQQGYASSETCKGTFPCLFQISGRYLQAIFGIPSLAATALHILPLPSHDTLPVCVCLHMVIFL